MQRSALASLLTTFIMLSGCAKTYYNAMESVGIHKRDILVSRIEKAQDSQEAARDQFTSALEQFKATVNFDGGDVEKHYNRLNREYENSVMRAEAVSERISDVSSVAEALFEEWELELDEISNTRLRSQSRQQLQETRQRYSSLIASMRAAESRIEPVLTTFNDHVLFLKHNLNARAIASLSSDLREVEADVSALLRDMQKAIDEASRFIGNMESNQA